MSRRRVVIVDDHAMFRSGVKAELGGAVQVVGEAPDVDKAVTVVLETRPDVVLLDVHLPGIDGFETASRIRAAGNGTAVILTSSRDASDFGPLVAASGARGFVAKGELSGAALRGLLS